jgi:hypothetical protein
VSNKTKKTRKGHRKTSIGVLPRKKCLNFATNCLINRPILKEEGVLSRQWTLKQGLMTKHWYKTEMAHLNVIDLTTTP